VGLGLGIRSMMLMSMIALLALSGERGNDLGALGAGFLVPMCGRLQLRRSSGTVPRPILARRRTRRVCGWVRLGCWWWRAAVGSSAADSGRLRDLVRENREHPTWELMWGSAGTMLAARACGLDDEWAG